MKTFVIINPRAGGRGMHRWPLMADQLYQALGLFEYEFTNAAGAATLLATQALRQGYQRILAVGGDGTVNEVLNGFFERNGDVINPEAVLGCLPAGSGTDLWKSLGIAEQWSAAVQAIALGHTRACDVGRVSLHTHDDKPLLRYFCNVADVGLGGEVVDRAKKLPSWGNGTVNYLWAAMTAFLQWKPAEMQLTVDGEPLAPERLVIALIANGQFCGGGMHVAPRAQLDDGVFDLVTLRDLPKWQLVQILPKLYSGHFEGLAAIQRRQAQSISITSAKPLRVTIDGEVPGQVPATFSVVPHAVRFCVGA